jgi:hypothetical protein
MLKRITYTSLFLILAGLFLFPSPLSADGAEIHDLQVMNSAEEVVVYARVTNCFTKDIEEAILAGVPTTFTFLVDLYRKRSGWMDKKLSRTTVHHTIKYDNVKKTFAVLSDGEKEAAAFHDFESAKRAMADLNGIPVAKRKALEPGESYYVMVKAKLDKVRLPLNMEVVFFFVSLWDFETGWYREEVPS